MLEATLTVSRPEPRGLHFRPVAGLLAFVLALAAPAAAANYTGTVYCHPAGPSRGGVLAIHGGGWQYGETLAGLRRLCVPFTRAGFTVAEVGYPLHDYCAALAHVRAGLRGLRRQAPGPVFGYGESAGANMALMVADHLAATVAVSPPTNLLTWPPAPSAWYYGSALMPMTLAQRFAASPVNRSFSAAHPVLLLASRDDTKVPYATQAAPLAGRPGITLATYHGEHLTDEPALVARAIAWLNAARAHGRT